MKEILLSELTIMEELGSGKFAVSCGLVTIYLFKSLNIDDDVMMNM